MPEHANKKLRIALVRLNNCEIENEMPTCIEAHLIIPLYQQGFSFLPQSAIDH